MSWRTVLAFVLIGAWSCSVQGAAAATFRVVHRFDVSAEEGSPYGGLIKFEGGLVGTSFGGSKNTGKIFKLDPATGVTTVVYSSPSQNAGFAPSGPLTAVAGSLYGVTAFGGVDTCGSGCGTVFKLNPATGHLRVLYSFRGGEDGFAPNSALAYLGGDLYGTTAVGGIPGGPSGFGYGTLFKIDPVTGKKTTLHAFTGYPNDGSTPAAGLLNVGGILYGTTANGGSHNSTYIPCLGGCGTVFTYDPATGNETIVQAFSGGDDGSNPSTVLTRLRETLYGTTKTGGVGACPGGCGTVFKLPLGGVKSVLYAFPKGNPHVFAFPEVNQAGGMLYGTTVAGGPFNMGTVFKLNPKTGQRVVLYAFRGRNDGYYPGGNLVRVGDTLYGTAASSAGGIVFAITP